MNTKTSVNLFQAQANLPPVLSFIEGYLRKIRFVLLTFIVCTGLVILGLHLYLSNRINTLEGRKTQLTAAVQQQVTTEAMLFTLRVRIAALKKILLFQKSIAPYIDVTMGLASPPRLTSFSLGENNKVQISVYLTSMNEAVELMKKIVDFTNAGKIRNPGLISFSIEKNGFITMGIVYTVILTN